MKITINCLLVFLVAAQVSFGQIAISNVGEIEKIKSGTTFVAMKDPNALKSKEYQDAFQKNWTFSKVAFIKYTDIEKNIAPNNSFITIGGFTNSVQSIGGSGNADYSNTHLYLELWTTNGNFVYNPKKRKHFDNKDKIQIGRIELFTDFASLINPDNLYKSDYDSNGHIRNWGAGILSNYIQNLTVLLNKGQEQKLFSEIVNKDELKKLSNETLFVPDYVLTKFNKFTGDESKKHEEKEIFDDYKLKYKLLSTSELNTKIINEKTPFYYLIYIKSSTDKFISIVNSITGEFIYSAYTPLSYNIKSGDLKDIQKAIQKK